MAQMTCPNCGKQVYGNVKTCPYCNHAIKGAGKLPWSGMNLRKVMIAVIALLVIWQIVILCMIASKSCSRSQEKKTEQIQAGNSKDDAHDNNDQNGTFAQVTAPKLPAQMEFCGEKNNLDRIDMAERLDKELIITIYNQAQTALIIKRANRYFPVLIKILKQNKIPEDIIYLAVAESAMNVGSVSTAGAAGIWQFMSSTATEYGLEVNNEVDERFDIEKSTVAACQFLRKAYSQYGNWATACASYNSGMGKMSSELSDQQASNSFDLRLVSESSRYVFRIIAYKLFLQNPKSYGYRLTSDQLYQPIDYEVVEVNTEVPSWVSWAKAHGISYMQLRDDNPWIRNTKLTNSTGKVYKVKVPKKDALYRSKTKTTVYNKNWVID